MSLYDELQIEAHELLSDPDIRQGNVRLIREVLGTAPNEWTPPSVTSTAYRLNAVVTPIRSRFAEGTLITEKKVLVIASVFADVVNGASNVTLPTPNPETDKISIDGDVRRIISCTPTPPAGVPVVWKIEVED